MLDFSGGTYCSGYCEGGTMAKQKHFSIGRLVQRDRYGLISFVESFESRAVERGPSLTGKAKVQKHSSPKTEPAVFKCRCM